MAGKEQHTHYGDGQSAKADVIPQLARNHAAQYVGVFHHHGRIGCFVGKACAVVDGSEETLPPLLAGRTHHHGTEGRAEYQGTHAGQTDCRCQRHTELGVENTSRTACEANRDEYRHEHEGTGNNRHRHIAHGIPGGFVGAGVSGIELRLHRLHHNNGIIDHSSDGKHQGKERQQVQGKSG